MRPPPLPPSGNQNSLPRQIALASLVAPLLAILVRAAFYAANQGAEPSRMSHLISGGICVLLIGGGFVLAVIALCSIPRHGTRGILGRGIAGALVNGALVLFFVTGIVGDYVKRQRQSVQAVRDLQSASEDAQRSLRESYDPELGITNIDSGRLDRLAGQLENAADQLSGDDALVMQAMSSYLAGLQGKFKQYEAAAKEFTDAGVLGLETLTAKSQIEPRREIVQRFLAANAELKGVVAGSEANVRSNLVRLHISSDKIEACIRGFNAKAAPRRGLMVRIRECDQKMGDAALGALDLLEAQWGQWHYAALANEITFTEERHNEAYGEYVNQINAAAEEQVKLQGRLIRLQ